MSAHPLFQPLTLARGPAMPNRIALSPMTTDMARPDGVVGDEEHRWIEMRARGGFGFVMTSASYVQETGKGGAGQTGIWSDDHVGGLAMLAHPIKAEGAVATLQLHHAGIRASRRHVPVPVGPSANAETNARALSTAEVEDVVQSFVDGARRAERAGFDGVELHGAHGYLLAQFLSAEINHRDDRYGGSLENRARLINEIIEGVRRSCRPDFQLGLRLSPERFGMEIAEMREFAAQLMADGRLDWLDLSLWDARKRADQPEFAERRLVDCFTDLPRGSTRLGVAGRIATPRVASELLDAGVDFVFIGRNAILHHDWANRARDPDFEPVALPVTEYYLAGAGLGPRFIRYMHTFPGILPARTPA